MTGERRRREPIGFIRGAHENNCSIVQPIYKDKILRIGVSPESHVQIKQKFVSPIHCEILFREAGTAGEFCMALITDKSENGTYMNGKLIGINQTAVLYPGCIISIVSKHLSFMYVQAHNSSLNYTYDENFLVPLHSENAIDDKNKEISVTLKRIGKGSQSEVYLSNVSFSPRHQLACKRYSLNINQANYTKKEIDVLKSNKHVNVISMISEFEKDETSYIFTPLYTGGTLEERINREWGMKEDDVFFIFHQISQGLQYLHQKGIIHCDLKPDNILLGGLLEKPRAVIIDFGLSTISKPENRWPSNFGTLGYHSPEMVREELFTEKVDCWALGVIVFQMLSKCHPFTVIEKENPNDIEYRILNEEPNYDLLYDGTSDHAKNVIKGLLMKDPKKRSTIHECLYRTTDDCPYSNWAFMFYNRPIFYTSYFNARKEFKKERAFWFGDEEEIPIKKKGDGMVHPDDDEKLANELKRKRGDGEGCIIKIKEEDNILFKHECTSLNEERFVFRTLEKKPLISYSFSSSSSSNN